MKIFSLITLTFLFSHSLFAADCPVKFGTDDYLGQVVSLVQKAESCEAWSDIVEACALGASGDVYTVSAAIDKCEKNMPKMSSKDQATYNDLNQKCEDKYKNIEGTLYLSMKFFCHLSVTKMFDELLSPVESEN